MSAKARLNRELDRLEPHLPAWGARWLRRIRSRAATIVRIPLAVVLIAAGFVGFLPILGFWMIPLGLLVLSVDLPVIRRLRRRLTVWWHRDQANDKDQVSNSEPPNDSEGR
jgi:hypothetical protein